MSRLTRWRRTHPEQVKAQRRRYYKRGHDLSRHYAAWTPRELRLVLEAALPDAELARRLRRSVNAVQKARQRARQRSRA